MGAPFGIVPTGTPTAGFLATLERYGPAATPLLAVADLADVDPGAPLLTLWRSGRADAYVAVDPRVTFLRPFAVTEFLAPDGRPVTVASERPERRVAGPWPAGDEADRARSLLGVTGSRRLVGEGLAVLSTDLLRSFEEQFLAGRGWSLADALAACPDELAWYTAWAEASLGATLTLREPLVALLDTPDSRMAVRLAGVTDADLARGYLGVVWPDAPGAVDSRAQGLAESMSMGSLAGALARRLTRTAPRVQRALHLDG